MFIDRAGVYSGIGLNSRLGVGDDVVLVKVGTEARVVVKGGMGMGYLREARESLRQRP